MKDTRTIAENIRQKCECPALPCQFASALTSVHHLRKQEKFSVLACSAHFLCTASCQKGCQLRPIENSGFVIQTHAHWEMNRNFQLIQIKLYDGKIIGKNRKHDGDILWLACIQHKQKAYEILCP